MGTKRSRELDRLAVRGARMGCGPGFFASEKRSGVAQSVSGDEAFESREPMLVVMRTIIGLASIGRGFEFVSERGGPFLPSEIAPLGKFDGECEGLGLPGFGKDWPALITRKLRQLGVAFAYGIRLAQDSHPTYPRKRNR